MLVESSYSSGGAATRKLLSQNNFDSSETSLLKLVNFFFSLFFTQEGTPHVMRFYFDTQETVEEARIAPGTAAAV
jgi:hypothetical protein